MNWIVYHIVSGHAFFTGLLLLTISAYASIQARPIFARVAAISYVIGCLFMVASSTPMPLGLVVLGTAITVFWVTARFKENLRRRACFYVCAFIAIAAILELPFHIRPTLKSAGSRSVTIIGDSATAGMGREDSSETWPLILARKHNIKVQDISHVGETAGSAIARVNKHSITSPIVIIEIGGNDILGSTSPRKFARDLDTLLLQLSAENRQLVMFELPLPPFYHPFGRVQRTAAAKHNVTLIPKRVFLSVIAGNSSTLDSIHLSQSGHQLMADSAWRILVDAFPENLERDE